MSETRRLTVELPATLVRMLEDKVAAGYYASESDAVRDGLETLRDHPGPSDDWLRAEAVPVLQACLDEPSRLTPLEDVFDRLDARYRDDMRRRGREP